MNEKRSALLKNLFSAVSIGIAFVLLVVFFFSADGLSTLQQLGPSLRPGWLFGAGLCMAVFWLLEAVVLLIIIRRTRPAYRFTAALQTGMVGQFYSAVTPFSTGGQPMQVMQMHRHGLAVGDATSAITLKSLVFQVTLIGYAAVCVATRLDYFITNVNNFAFVAVAGLSVQALIIAALVVLASSQTLAQRITGALLRWLTRIRIIKNPQKIVAGVLDQVDEFYRCSRMTRKDILPIGAALLLTAVQFTAYFAVPYCIYRALGFTAAGPFTMVAAMAFVYVVSMFVPLPGASGGAEGSFLLLFGLFFQGGTLTAAILLWRITTYYLNIAIGCLFTLPGKRRKAD